MYTYSCKFPSTDLPVSCELSSMIFINDLSKWLVLFYWFLQWLINYSECCLNIFNLWGIFVIFFYYCRECALYIINFLVLFYDLVEGTFYTWKLLGSGFFLCPVGQMFLLCQISYFLFFPSTSFLEKYVSIFHCDLDLLWIIFSSYILWFRSSILR